jgi:hypothetical protein
MGNWMAPSRWTLAEQVERDRVAAELHRRKAKRRQGKGLRKWAKRWPKIQAERKRKAFKARHAGLKAAQRLKIERWMAAGGMRYFRPLEEVKAARARISRSLEAGKWYGWKELVEATGMAERHWLADSKWAVDAGVLEVRTVAATGPSAFSHGRIRQWRWTGKIADYEPDKRRVAMYKLQELAAVLNG